MGARPSWSFMMFIAIKIFCAPGIAQSRRPDDSTHRIIRRSRGHVNPQYSPDEGLVNGLDATSQPCSFAYPGPLRKESFDCFSEFIPGSVSFKEPFKEVPFTGTSNRFFTLRGVQWQDGPPPVPVFIMFKDRVSVLLETLRSFWRHIHTPYEIIILNDNSTFPATVAFLNRLRESGVTIHDNTQAWSTFDELYNTNADYIDSFMAGHASNYYILTDPDCALDSAPWNILFVYQAVLDGLGVDAVGAALRWDDFPEYVDPSYDYETAFVKFPAEAVEYKAKNYYYIKAPVDTTFAMYRKGPRLRRLKAKYIRMLPPLGARHLDYYLAKDNLPEDYKHYFASARLNKVNHMAHLE